jgi:cytochrome c biogenesis protein CcmG/thiol:disulfide interchange protein DsbE
LTEQTQGSVERKGTLLRLLPIGLFLALAFLLWLGLWGDPQYLPSALEGKKLPSFTVERLHDARQTHSTADFLGEPFLVNVWATWCPACYKEHPTLMRLAKAGVPMVGLNYKDEREAAIRYLVRYKDPFKWSIFDGEGDLGFDLGVYGAPETFFVDAKGVVLYRHVGEITDEIWNTELAPKYEAIGGPTISLP